MDDKCPETVDAPALPAKETNSATALALKATFAIPLFYANKGIQLAETALDIALPFISKLQHLRSEINKSINTENEKDSDAISKKTKEDALIQTSNTLITNANKNIEETPENLEEIITNLNNELEKIKLKLSNPVSLTTQIGGKKIISRTHKSINLFLNPKITAANMLKSKKRFRNNTKSKYKYKSKKRRFH
jgi:hypothetical protein